ncbi:hypothetical protein H5410_050967 [Solanum commersonii]|uniref:Uncharacterized protein n=1 Tax=Solanum commersonii TaxID=4109 RepID=A0A9J5WZ54_SOLCO|nr:hypothetical protein H5410_050967 [Solanum commersonii]
MARVKIQIDRTKARPPHVWLGFKNSDPNKGRWQKIQYEGIPDYCHYCKHQGHVDNVCTIKRRDEEFQRRKEMEAGKQNKTKGEQEKGGTKTQVQDNGRLENNTREQEILATGNEEEGNSNRTAGQGSHLMQGSDKDLSLITPYNKTTRQKEQAAVTKNNKTSGIDSLIPSPKPLDTIDSIAADEAVGGMEGRVAADDYRIDSRAPATPISNQKKAEQHVIQEGKEMATETEQQKDRPNNKSGGRLSKKKRDAMKKRQEKCSELEQILADGQVNKSIEEYDAEDEETSNHLIQAFGSTINTECSEEVRELTEQQDKSQLNSVRIHLQMDHATSNPNGKIWHFWSNAITGNIHENSDQHITGDFKHSDLTEKFMVSFIYAKCKEHMRKPLWDSLLQYASLDIPWCTIGDFNVITSIEEKLGGMPCNINKSFEFISVIEACGLTDLGFTGIPYTWCNQRTAQARVWKRLDRSMVNDKWLEVMPQTTIEHLSSVGSDHNPLLMEMVRKNENHIKYFKFLHCWVDNANFMETVRKCWERVVTGNDVWIQGDDQIAQAACEYFQGMSTGQNRRIDERFLQHFPTLLINKDKSHFMVPSNTSHDIINNIQEVTGFSQKDSPLTYLGCPLYIGRQRIIYYSQLVEKVSKKICGWQARILSFGGKITLVNHALQSIPIHTMATVSPPSTTNKYIESIIADFFWGRDQDKRKYHWASLETMSLPYDEGGVGIRRLSDICTFLQYKLWWNFRAKSSLWGQFLKSKYCQRDNPVAKKVDTSQSLVWRYMMKNKNKVEDHITWKLKSKSFSFWWDDWLGIGALANYTTNISSLNNATIAHFLVNGNGMSEKKLRPSHAAHSPNFETLIFNTSKERKTRQSGSQMILAASLVSYSLGNLQK